MGKKLVFDYLKKHANAKSSFEMWVAEVECAGWRTPQDIKARYSTASFLHNNLVVFNIKGNSYRLVVIVLYEESVVRIMWVGTHAEYEKKIF